ncbi:diguanylate cyclase domain-containing protein [Novosphingobium barchaimii]|uniref:diguanylate cyclase domain-containing protein n=1 Tax=Novosphingobium barchaimii TaxID=1420591 RepID=UPI0038B38CE4
MRSSTSTISSRSTTGTAHAAGDLVLARFAAILRFGMREGDLIARPGEEEFAYAKRSCVRCASVFASAPNRHPCRTHLAQLSARR